MWENPYPSMPEISRSVRTLIRLLEDGEVQSLAATYYYMREREADPGFRDILDEVVLTSLRHIGQILRALETVLMEALREKR